jgi:arabinofuranosyltransferase
VGALLGLGPLVRPDLAVVSVVVIAAVLWARRPRGAELVSLIGGFVALPVVYEVFRAGYYGTLVPNTALAKDSGGTYWSQGWNYLVDLVAPYWLWLPLLAVAAVAVLVTRDRSPGPSLVPLLALPVGGILHALFIVESGGDYLHARLLLPSLFAVVAPFAVVPWRPRLRIPVLVVGVWALVAIAFLRPDVRQALVPVTDYGVADGRALMSNLTRPGHDPVLATDFRFDDGPRAKRLQASGARALVTTTGEPLLDVTPARTTLVTQASGISGYRAGPDVLVQEVNSLGDPVGSRMTTTPNSHPGHRKRETWPWILALTTRPGTEDGLDVSVLENGDFPSPPLRTGEVAAARHALRCGALASLREATRDPLDAGRFWSNLTGAIGRTRLVVPRDPIAAERRFCGHPRTNLRR